jgi:hypothetical protein
VSVSETIVRSLLLARQVRDTIEIHSAALAHGSEPLKSPRFVLVTNPTVFAVTVEVAGSLPITVEVSDPTPIFVAVSTP